MLGCHRIALAVRSKLLKQKQRDAQLHLWLGESAPIGAELFEAQEQRKEIKPRRGDPSLRTAFHLFVRRQDFHDRTLPRVLCPPFFGRTGEGPTGHQAHNDQLIVRSKCRCLASRFMTLPLPGGTPDDGTSVE
jgi:hypothetical protein